MELEARAGTILPPTPTRRPNIYICCPVGWSGKMLDRCDKRTNLTAMLFIMFCSALHITITGGLFADPGVLMQQFEGFRSLFPSSSPSVGHFRSLLLCLLFRICIKYRRFPQNLTGVFIPLLVSPPFRLKWSAEQRIMDSIAVIFGPLVMPVQYFAHPPHGQQM